MRQKGEQCENLESEHVLFHKGIENNSRKSVGIMIHKDMAKYIRTMKVILGRIIYVTLQVNKKFIQIHAHTSQYKRQNIYMQYQEALEKIKEYKTAQSKARNGIGK